MGGARLLCLVSAIAFFYRQYRLLGIPLPSPLLMFGLLLVNFYRISSRESIYIEHGLLLLLVAFTLVARQPKWLLGCGLN